MTLYICNQFSREVSEVINQLSAYDIEIRYLDGASLCRVIDEDQFSFSHADNPLVIGGSCLNSIKKKSGMNLFMNRGGSCLNMFCGSEKIDAFLADGAYIVTPGWLENWESYLGIMGVSEDNSHVIFRDRLKKILFLDTGVDEDSVSKLKTFSDFVSLPYEIYNAGLDYFRLFLTSQIKWAEGKNRKENLIRENNRLKQHLTEKELISDMIMQLSRLTSRDAVIDKLFDCFLMFTAAEILCYYDKAGRMIKKYPESGEITLIDPQSLFGCDKEVVLPFHDDGIIVRFKNDGKTIGYLRVEKFLLKEKIKDYVEITQSIYSVCSLTLSNAIQYDVVDRKRRESELFSKILEMLMASIDEVDEIQNILMCLKEYTGIQEIGLRLKKDDDFPVYFNSSDHREKEHFHCTGGVFVNNCLCGRLLSGKVSGIGKYFSDHGSLYIKNLKEISKKNGFGQGGYCTIRQFETMLIIPLITDEGNMGLIQFHDEKQDYFSVSEILFLEKIIMSIGIALNKKKMDQARIMAESANRAKNRFISTISHEIKTPLNIIMGSAKVLNISDMPEKQRRYLSLIHKSGENLMLLLDDILDLSKLEENRLELQQSPSDIRALINELMMMFEGQMEEKGLIFKTEITERVPEPVLIDKVRIRQILFNLIGNAVKFTWSGFVEVGIDMVPAESEEGQMELILYVKDSGIGIPPDEIDFIFQDFYQISSKDNRDYAGSGLGLAIVKRLVNKMNGSIDLESEKGEGSKFTVTLTNAGINDSAADFPGIGERGEKIIRGPADMPSADLMPSQFSAEFREKFLESLKNMTGAVVISDARHIIQEMADFSKINDVNAFENWERQISMAVDSFNIKSISELFSAMIDYLEGIGK